MNVKEQVGDWYNMLEPMFKMDYFQKLIKQHRHNVTTSKVYPERGKVLELLSYALWSL